MAGEIHHSAEQAPVSPEARRVFESVFAPLAAPAQPQPQPQPQPSLPPERSVVDEMLAVPREGLACIAAGLALMAAGLGIALARRAGFFRGSAAPIAAEPPPDEPEVMLTEAGLYDVPRLEEEPFEERITQEIPRAEIQRSLEPREVFTGSAAIFANLAAEDLWTQVAGRGAQWLALPEERRQRILSRADPQTLAIVNSVLMPLRWAARREAEDHLRFRLSQDPGFEELSEAKQQEVLRAAMAFLDNPSRTDVADGRGGLKPRWLDRVFKVNAGFDRAELFADRLRTMPEFLKYPRELLRRWGVEVARRWDALSHPERSIALFEELRERKLLRGRDVHAPKTFSDGRALNDVQQDPRAVPGASGIINLNDPPDRWLREELSQQLDEGQAWDAAFREGDISGAKAIRAHEIHRQLYREYPWFREAFPEHRFQISARIAAWSQEPVYQQHYITPEGLVRPEGLRIVGESISRYADRLSTARVNVLFPEGRERAELPRPRWNPLRPGK